jgi:alkanesulfonate monooxygenase SsuD/methylene tetrahydromethanopterin reductase-like flavin-dependent oxidoreductase (luciferase family)
MIGVNALVADTDVAAKRLFTSQQQAFANLLRGVPTQVPPPIDDIDSYWSPREKEGAERMLRLAVVGSPATVEHGLRRLVEATAADELILTGHVYAHEDRLRSYEHLATIRDRLSMPSPYGTGCLEGPRGA